jgi:diphthamide synthase (EF-2-diphthine--ammonia ligase)
MLPELERLGEEKGLDLCGENGEYHTMVLGGPGFESHLSLTGCERVELLPPDWKRPERCWYLKVGHIDRVATLGEAALVHFAA